MTPVARLLFCVGLFVGGCSSGTAAPARTVPASPVLAEGTVEVGGSAIRYQRAGDDSSPTLSLLFLHGAAFTSDTWIDNGILAASAESSDFQAVAVDLPGYGESPSTSVARQEFVPALMSALGLDLSATVIISPSMSGGFSLGALRTGALDDLAGFVGVAPVGSADFANSLASPLVVPALAVWGDEDGGDPRSSAQALARGFTDGEVVVLANAGHAAYNQQPEQFVSLLREFANRLPACHQTCLD